MVTVRTNLKRKSKAAPFGSAGSMRAMEATACLVNSR
jgi:hypothetical protein